MAKQVWGIALVSVLLWIGAGITIAGALIALFLGSTLVSLGLSIGLPDFSTMVYSAAWLSLFIGILYILLGIFLWKHNKWAWWITFGLTILGLVTIVPSIWAFSPILIFAILLPIFELAMLTHNDSMGACKVKLAGWKGW